MTDLGGYRRPTAWLHAAIPSALLATRIGSSSPAVPHS